ncbi:MAG: hypothetical protein A2081_04985 [Elusimicrobia bacterium GWC2_61_19]|nr:MAG: hypothetical protein A2081_04985 [Elusimicrobia bacterium GWC2_61_19]
MKTFGIIVSALLTTAFMFLGKERDPDFYLAALAAGWVFFRLTVGSDCPIVWLMSKLGVKGLACPTAPRK